MKKFIRTSERVEVSDYPYGFRLRCTLFDFVEFNPKKGYRHGTQTTNPKAGNKLNKPKVSTYSHIIVRWYDEETNHIKWGGFDLNSDKGLNNASTFISENFDLFDKEEIEYFASQFLLYSKVSMQGTVIYGGAKVDDLKPLYEKFVNQMVKQMTNPTENFFGALLDIQAIEATKPEGFNPFKVTKYDF